MTTNSATRCRCPVCHSWRYAITDRGRRRVTCFDCNTLLPAFVCEPKHAAAWVGVIQLADAWLPVVLTRQRETCLDELRLVPMAGERLLLPIVTDAF